MNLKKLFIIPILTTQLRWHFKSSKNISNWRWRWQLCWLAHEIQLFYYFICRYIVSAPFGVAVDKVSVFTIYMRNPDRSQVRQCQHVRMTIAVTRQALSIESMRSGLGPGDTSSWDRTAAAYKKNAWTWKFLRYLAESDRSLGVSCFARKRI